jgi:RNA polymerase sigma-70 factor, ECF subfamily
MQTITGTETQNGEFFSQEYLHPIYRYVYSYVRNQQEAEDLTSQIFLKALRHLDQERSAYYQRAWLFRVARTTIADHWRIHYRRAGTQSLEMLVEAGWEGPVAEEGVTLESSAAENRV